MRTPHRYRISKGYRYIYAPDSPSVAKTGSYKGYVFEHRYVMEKHLGRALTKNEHIHHIDFNKLNNNISNLMLLTNREHTRLHHLIKEYQLFNGVDSYRKCIDCGEELSYKEHSKSKVLRCRKCATLHSRKVLRPTKEELAYDVYHHTYLSLSSKYGVSTNAIKKWMRSYGIPIPNRHKNWICEKPYEITQNRLRAWANLSEKIKELKKGGTACDIPVVQLNEDGTIVAEYRSSAEACRQNIGFSDSPIYRCCKGKLKTYKGFIWRYKSSFAKKVLSDNRTVAPCLMAT